MKVDSEVKAGGVLLLLTITLIVSPLFRWKFLRYGPILAVKAVKVAPCSGKRIDFGSREKVKQGLLFDRIYRNRARISVRQRI